MSSNGDNLTLETSESLTLPPKKILSYQKKFLIRLLSEYKYSASKLAVMFEIHISTVHRILKKFNETSAVSDNVRSAFKSKKLDDITYIGKL